MKTFTLLLVSVLSLTAACATDDADYRTGTPGLRPAYKPVLGNITDDSLLPDDQADIEDSIDSGSDADPRSELPGTVSEWAEDFLIDGRQVTRIHRADGTEELVDADGLTLLSHSNK